jgi:hypothetical protein
MMVAGGFTRREKHSHETKKLRTEGDAHFDAEYSIRPVNDLGQFRARKCSETGCF